MVHNTLKPFNDNNKTLSDYEDIPAKPLQPGRFKLQARNNLEATKKGLKADLYNTQSFLDKISIYTFVNNLFNNLKVENKEILGQTVWYQNISLIAHIFIIFSTTVYATQHCRQSKYNNMF